MQRHTKTSQRLSGLHRRRLAHTSGKSNRECSERSFGDAYCRRQSPRRTGPISHSRNTEKGRPLILLHGGSPPQYSNPIVPRFAGEHTVIVPHRRGVGNSGDTEEHCRDRGVEDVRAIIDGGPTEAPDRVTAAVHAFIQGRETPPTGR
ncbi:Alpha/beta superfamily hydrolase [Halomicrobium sp. LC1Hm]|nr:Alpha/beta superfamily hydrolase [Halomicrobium sp. LC1Hm]